MSDSESASDSGDDSPMLILDSRFPGRVALLRPEIADPDGADLFGFASFQGALGLADEGAALNLDPLLADCRRAFTATSVQTGEESSGGLGVSSGDTYWVPAADTDASEEAGARCGLEALAREIFAFHCARLGLEAGRDFDPTCSGAEWWTQCIEGDAEIGLHWDKDFSLEEQSGVDLFPHLATVTYLTNGRAGSRQAPTIVLEHTPAAGGGDDAKEDVEEDDENENGEKGETEGGGGGSASRYASRPLGVRRAWLSCAKPGKHVCFNGGHLHGAFQPLNKCFAAAAGSKAAAAAPAPKRQKVTASKAAAAVAEPDSQLRVTFLVNLWFNWKPLGCDPLPIELAAEMATPADAKATASLAFGRPAEQATHPLQWPGSGSSASEAPVLRRRFEQRGRGHVLELPLASDMKTDDDEASESEDEDASGETAELELPWRLPFGASAALSWGGASGQGPTARVFLDPNGDSGSEDDDEDSSSDAEDEDEGEDEDEEMSNDEKRLRLVQALIETSSLRGRRAAKARARVEALCGGEEEGGLSAAVVAECEAAALAALQEMSLARADTHDDYSGGEEGSGDEGEGQKGSGEDDYEEGGAPAAEAGNGFEVVD